MFHNNKLPKNLSDFIMIVSIRDVLPPQPLFRDFTYRHLLMVLSILTPIISIVLSFFNLFFSITCLIITAIVAGIIPLCLSLSIVFKQYHNYTIISGITFFISMMIAFILLFIFCFIMILQNQIPILLLNLFFIPFMIALIGYLFDIVRIALNRD